MKYLDLPLEVQIAMLNEQFKVQKKANADVFISCKETGTTEGGFNWYSASYGMEFWGEVINAGNFSLFFSKYRKLTYVDTLDYALFPSDIIAGLKEEQVTQGNLPDILVFVNHIGATKRKGGIDWRLAKCTHWDKILIDKQLIYYYQFLINRDNKIFDLNAVESTSKSASSISNTFPPGLLHLIKTRQVEQGNTPNLDVFDVNPYANKGACGFNWLNTEEGEGFWMKVLVKKDLDPYYSKQKDVKTVEDNGLRPTPYIKTSSSSHHCPSPPASPSFREYSLANSDMIIGGITPRFFGGVEPITTKDEGSSQYKTPVFAKVKLRTKQKRKLQIKQ